MKCIRLLSIFAGKFAKNMFCQWKIQENTKYPETEGQWWEKEQNYKRNYGGQQIIQTEENGLNQIKEISNKFKISINTERNLI